jgi:type IV secretory pathway VirB2 component (pilin)
MKNKLILLWHKIQKAKYKLLGMATVMVMSSPVLSFAASSVESANKAAKGTTEYVGKITKAIIPIVVVAIGIALLIGGQRAREGVKEGAAYKIIGLILIFGALVIGQTIAKWF